MWSDNASWTLDGMDHPHEATYLKLDCTKAKQRLGWWPVLNLEQALNWVVDWYRCLKNGDDMRETTLRQINSYEDRIGNTET